MTANRKEKRKKKKKYLAMFLYFNYYFIIIFLTYSKPAQVIYWKVWVGWFGSPARLSLGYVARYWWSFGV